MTEPTINQSFRDLFLLLWNKRTTILIIGFVAAAISAAVSFLLPEYFVSSVTIFPSRVNSIVLTEGVIRGNVSDFGEEEEAEQTLQIIESEQLVDMVVEKTNLYEHYEIDKKDPFARTKMYQTYMGQC